MAASRGSHRLTHPGVGNSQSACLRGWRADRHCRGKQPLTRLQQSLSGPVAGAIAIIALVAIGVTLVFGGEWNEFARRAGVRRLRNCFHHFRGCLAGRLVRGRRGGRLIMDGPREVPFHESANRPQLLMGGDRELILVSAILAAMLVFAVMKWWSILGGLVLWLIAVGVLARMAKVDPLLRHVYIRHIRYRDFYPAKSRMSAPPTTTPANWR